jgi:hypothetical protein
MTFTKTSVNKKKRFSSKSSNTAKGWKWPHPTGWYLVVFVLAFALVGGFELYRSFAATATQFYLSPSSTSVNASGTFTVAVRINPGTTVDTVDTTLTYDPAVLQFVSADGSGSPFTTEVLNSGGSGTVHLTRTVLAPDTVSSDALIANINFTALAGAPNSALALSGHVAYQGTEVVGTSTSGTVTVNPPPDTTAPTVTITSPASGASGSKFTIAAKATDNVGVTKMEAYGDTTLLTTNTASSLNYSWTTKSTKTPRGTHTITVKAYDAAGNVGSASVNVTTR